MATRLARQRAVMWQTVNQSRNGSMLWMAFDQAVLHCTLGKPTQVSAAAAGKPGAFFGGLFLVGLSEAG